MRHSRTDYVVIDDSTGILLNKKSFACFIAFIYAYCTAALDSYVLLLSMYQILESLLCRAGMAKTTEKPLRLKTPSSKRFHVEIAEKVPSC